MEIIFICRQMDSMFLLSTNGKYVLIVNKWRLCLCCRQMENMFLLSINGEYVSVVDKWKICACCRQMKMISILSPNEDDFRKLTQESMLLLSTNEYNFQL